MLLKDIPGILPALINSELSNSKLWLMNIQTISKYHIQALINKSKLTNPNTEIEKEISYAIQQINDAIYCGLINQSKVANYKISNAEFITVSDLINGLIKLKDVYRKAVLFALETKSSLDEVASLTNAQAAQLAQESRLASEILSSCITSIKIKYVFWESSVNNHHHPLHNLDHEVLKGFGFEFEKLSLKYKNIIYDDWFDLAIQ